MQELINHVLGEIRSALRFRWYGLTVAWIGCAAGWGAVFALPDVFEGSARFYVDTSSALEPVLGNQIITQDVDSQIAYVREALLGRDQLEGVIETAGFDAVRDSTIEFEDMLRQLRADIVIESVGPNRNTPDSIYTIRYRNTHPDRAVAVVRTLLDDFAAGTLGASQIGGDTAERFLDERVSEYEKRLEDAEGALAAFKKENADRLPGAEGDYFQRLQTERDQLALARRELRILESKRDRLEQQLTMQSTVVTDVPGFDNEPPPNSLDARIRDYQAQLDKALLDFTDRHPDVIALREVLATLTAQRAEQLRALGIDDSDQELARLGANPVHQAVQIALNETEVEIATLETDVDERQANMAELQALINEVPEVEAELAKLNRDYEVVYEQYLELARSRETQELTRKASDADQIDFRIIDPPLASIFPVAPPRLLMLLGVFVAALGVGACVCYIGAQIWPVFSNTRSLAAVTELPVLGAISEAWNDRRTAEVNSAVRKFAGVFALLLLMFFTVVGLQIMGFGLHKIVGAQL